MAETSIDSVWMAIIHRRLEGIATKMQNTLLRTARSGVINIGRDFSCCIVTAKAELLAVGESLPIHVTVGADLMAQSMLDFHPVLRTGDAFLHNSPYHGCSHAADLSVLVPVIDATGVHRFTVVAKAHQADIGNSLPTTYHATARDVYEEGALLFAATKVQRDYRDIDDVVRMCMLRIRVPEQWRGDYLASLGAARVGERELLALGEEVGWERMEAYDSAWFDYSEARMVTAIRRMPSGRSRATCRHDPIPGSPPEGVPVQVTIEVDADGASIEIDLRDNIDCLPLGINVSEACARSAALAGLFNSIGDPELPVNAGSMRRVEVRLREGCIVGGPRHPTSCSMATTNVSDRLLCAVQLAVAELADGLGMAEIGPINTAAQAVVSGIDPRYERPFINQIIVCDTLGAASPHEDGWLTMISAGTAGLSHFDSIEVDELRYPLRLLERCIVADSEGAGRFRGAPSSRVTYEPVDCTMRAIYLSDGAVNPASGARGGQPGAPSRNVKVLRHGERIPADGWVDINLEPGERVIAVSCGGGGYGPATERDPARVAADIAEGYVSRERAEGVYGVILHTDGSPDRDATRARRRQLVTASTPAGTFSP